MNKIEELIQQLCPEGVEFKELGEIGKVCMCKRIMKNETNSTGDIPFYKIGTFGKAADAFISTKLYNEYKKKYSFPKAGDVLISASGTIGRTVIYDDKPAYFQDSNIVWIDNDESIVSNKFLFYYYKIVDWKTDGGTISRLYNNNLSKTKIPLPPLPVQQEIVSILDKFTQLEAELEVVLEAELEARKRQYEYYRNQLLNFEGKEVEWKTLGEVCTIQSGGTPSKNKSEYWDDGTIKWLGSTVCKNKKSVEEVTDYITEKGLKNSSAKLFKQETTLIALVGATIGKVAFLPFEATTNQNVAGLFPMERNRLNTSYLYYSCRTLYEVFTNLSQDKLKMANLSFVRGLKIPIPPLHEQERIVRILDKFESLVNDISVGLTAEIQARRKQYEYYRGKLLDFKDFNNG